MGVQVTHLGYYETEQEAAKVYDRVALSIHGRDAQVNYDGIKYDADTDDLLGLSREELQRALGVKPMDKSSQYGLHVPRLVLALSTPAHAIVAPAPPPPLSASVRFSSCKDCWPQVWQHLRQ